MMTLAAGIGEGLRGASDRLELYDDAILLLCPPDRATDCAANEYLSEVTSVLKLHYPTLTEPTAPGSLALRGTKDKIVLGEWRGASQNASGDAARGADLFTRAPSQAGSTLLLMENGIVYPSIEACGPHSLRALRLRFATSVIAALRSMMSGSGELLSDRMPSEVAQLQVLDASELDATLSRVAVQVAVENGASLEECSVTCVPLTAAAASDPSIASVGAGSRGPCEAERTIGAATAGAESIVSLVRLVVSEPGKHRPDALAQLPTRSFHVAAFTAVLPERSVGTVPGSDAHAQLGKSLARVIAATRAEGVVWVTLLSPQESAVESHVDRCDLAAAQEQSRLQHPVASEARARLNAAMHSLVAEALSRNSRWGDIEEEVWPEPDCPNSSLTLKLSLD